jgi:hypothetical protein
MKLDVKNHNKPVPKLWYRILLTLHGILGLSVVVSAFEDKPWVGMGLMLTGYILDHIIRFIRQDNPEIDA